MNPFDVRNYLPTSVKEMEALGWDYVDVVLFSGDAYVDHPSFGAAVIGRVLQAAGYRVAIVPQPNWRDDLRDFRKFGRPRLFFGVSAGAMDSMVNHYTANRRKRHDDAYTPGGKAGMRPDYPTIVYSQILKDLYPDVPVIAGGIEASLRRVSHYDYWQDRLRPSILADCRADMITYGMGEHVTLELAGRLADGEKIGDITDLRQTVVRRPLAEIPAGDSATDVILSPWDTVRRDKRAQSMNFRIVEEESNTRDGGRTLWQAHDGFAVKINPMYPAMSQGEIDMAFDLPFTRMPHPRYKGKPIAAYEMIRHSVNLHRGCFGGCAFCTISAHQGKFIASRSKESIMREVRQIVQMPDFKGYISDLGGPSANMYAMHGRNLRACEACRRPSCLHPKVCPNLDNDHRPLLDIYHSVDAMPQVKKSFIGSGVRYDLSMHPSSDPDTAAANRRYNRELIRDHVSGRLKVAPEHTEDCVLDVMRKPSFDLFYDFKRIFDEVNRTEGLPPRLPRNRHGGAGLQDQGPGDAPRAGAGFHPHAHDGEHRDLLLGHPPIHRRKSLHGRPPRGEAGPAAVFLLVRPQLPPGHRGLAEPPPPPRPHPQALPRRHGLRTARGQAGRGVRPRAQACGRPSRLRQEGKL